MASHLLGRDPGLSRPPYHAHPPWRIQRQGRTKVTLHSHPESHKLASTGVEMDLDGSAESGSSGAKRLICEQLGRLV